MQQTGLCNVTLSLPGSSVNLADLMKRRCNSNAYPDIRFLLLMCDGIRPGGVRSAGNMSKKTWRATWASEVGPTKGASQTNWPRVGLTNLQGNQKQKNI